MTKLAALVSFALVAAAGSTAAPASYDSAGAITALICDGAEFPVHGRLVATFDGGVEATLQPHEQRSAIARDGGKLSWSGETTFPNGARARFAGGWTESADGTLIFEAKVTNPAEWPLLLRSLEYVVDLPRESLVGGRLEPAGIALTATKPADATFFRGTTAIVRLVDAQGNWTFALGLDAELPVEVSDRWDAEGRGYRVRIRLWSGVLLKEVEVAAKVTLRLTGHATAAPVALAIQPDTRLYPFDGFGANYCWGTETAVTPYLLANLHVAWTRHELKAILWDQQQAAPGPMLTSDFERIRGIQQSGIPWIISLWRLPERFYTDPNRVSRGTFGRKIAGERWPELLDLIGGYLLNLKTKYGAEPDLFSFNEPDLGVSIGLAAEEHRDAVKRIGAHLAKLGLKTKFLLGETANPRDSHTYVLATAADAEAMTFVGAISAHSWGSGSPEQYRAWAEVAAWLKLPLIIGEAGTDPGSYRNHSYDAYAYGLQEARQTQELLRYAKPQASLYWQFTADYALVRLDEQGAVVPTGRFWLMKQFTNLTPMKSQAVATASDRPEVLVSGFAKGNELVIHILNTGPACAATVAGLPPGQWRSVTTTELAGYQESPATAETPDRLQLPARSLVTLVRIP